MIDKILSLQKLKSETAARAVKGMNPDVNILANQDRVGPETESILSTIYFVMPCKGLLI